MVSSSIINNVTCRTRVSVPLRECLQSVVSLFIALHLFSLDSRKSGGFSSYMKVQLAHLTVQLLSPIPPLLVYKLAGHVLLSFLIMKGILHKCSIMSCCSIGPNARAVVSNTARFKVETLPVDVNRKSSN